MGGFLVRKLVKHTKIFNSRAHQSRFGQIRSPQTNADGTPLKDLAGFRVHYGRERGKYTDVVDVGRSTTCSLQSLPCGRFYFAVTAYDTSGNESKPSNEVWKDVQ